MKSRHTEHPLAMHEALAIAFNAPNTNQRPSGGPLLERGLHYSMKGRSARLLMALAAVFSLAAALPAQSEDWYFYPTAGEDFWERFWTNCPPQFHFFLLGDPDID